MFCREIHHIHALVMGLTRACAEYSAHAQGQVGTSRCITEYKGRGDEEVGGGGDVIRATHFFLPQAGGWDWGTRIRPGCCSIHKLDELARPVFRPMGARNLGST